MTSRADKESTIATIEEMDFMKAGDKLAWDAWEVLHKRLTDHELMLVGHMLGQAQAFGYKQGEEEHCG